MKNLYPKKKLFFILRVSVTVGIFFILFKLVPYKELVFLYKHTSKFYISLGFFLVLLGGMVSAFRWQFISNALDINLSLREAVYATFSGTFFNLFFPSLLAGDAFRSVALILRFKNGEKALTSVIIDRFSGFLGMTLLAFLALFIGKNMVTAKEVFLGLTVIVIIGVSILVFTLTKFPFLVLGRVIKINSGLREKVEKMNKEFKLLRQNPYIFFKAVIFYSFSIQVLTVLSFFSLSKAFHLEIGILYFFMVIPIVVAIAFLPITIAGMGTRELAAVYFFSKVGIEPQVTLGIALLNLVFMLVLNLLGGIIYVMVYHRWLECSK